jgi:hypothetical protein
MKRARKAPAPAWPPAPTPAPAPAPERVNIRSDGSIVGEEESFAAKRRQGAPALRSLAEIRTKVLDAKADTQKMIGELENWRHEIECTLAFLKASK